jgi:hypothetical protein
MTAFLVIHAYAQVPDAINYQVVARDNGGNILVNQNVSFRLSLHTGTPAGAIVYSETHSKTTNPFGLVNLELGRGAVLSGSFSTIDWSLGIVFLQTEMDPAGGSNYLTMGTTQLLTVPYADYCKQTSGIRVLTDQQKGAIINPSEGSLIYNSTYNVPNIYSGGQWKCLSEPSVAEAGPDQKIPDGISSVTLSATAPAVGQGTWILWDGPPVTLSDIHDPNASFTGQSNTYYRFKWSVTNGCTTNFDFTSVVLGFVCGYSSVSFTYNGQAVTYGSVSYGNSCWMDRNLGASHVATSFDDPASFGDYFQWGRLIDGHQNSGSVVTFTLSSSDIPGHGFFIASMDSPNDWRSPQNDNLWQGANGANNPCPSGWRVASQQDFELAFSNWGGILSLFESPLRFPAAGNRDNAGNISSQGALTTIWTSTGYTLGNGNGYSTSIFATHSYDYYMENASTRVLGMPVRCVKE